MLSEVLSVGDKIDIKRIDHNNRPVHGAKAYVSQLIDFVDSNVVHIAAPIIYGRVIILEVGENFNLCFYSAKGLYQCNGVVLSNHRDNKTIVSVIRITTNLEKFQRREFFRLECIHDISYHLVTVEEEILTRRLKSNEFKKPEEREECIARLEQMNQESIPGSVTDISGGGIRFNSEIQHQHGDKIKMYLKFLTNIDKKILVVVAEVLVSSRIENRTGLFEHRVKFNDISQRDREVIIKYIFEQERKRRSIETN